MCYVECGLMYGGAVFSSEVDTKKKKKNGGIDAQKPPKKGENLKGKLYGITFGIRDHHAVRGTVKRCRSQNGSGPEKLGLFSELVVLYGLLKKREHLSKGQAQGVDPVGFF